MVEVDAGGAMPNPAGFAAGGGAADWKSSKSSSSPKSLLGADAAGAFPVELATGAGSSSQASRSGTGSGALGFGGSAFLGSFLVEVDVGSLRRGALATLSPSSYSSYSWSSSCSPAPERADTLRRGPAWCWWRPQWRSPPRSRSNTAGRRYAPCWGCPPGYACEAEPLPRPTRSNRSKETAIMANSDPQPRRGGQPAESGAHHRHARHARHGSRAFAAPAEVRPER